MPGRPPLSAEQIDGIVRKLEPYLKVGLSIRKACTEANIPKSTVYDLIDEDGVFADKIEALQNYLSARVTYTLGAQALDIADRVESKGKCSEPEIKFMQWMALNFRGCRDLFSRTVDMQLDLPDPHAHIQKIARMIDEATKGQLTKLTKQDKAIG